MSARSRGFTLIEVLLATVLLAAGLALAFATLRSATAMAQRGEAISQKNERMRAVDGFLRRRISAAQAIGFATDPASQRSYRFVGEPQRMRFVADLPDYLGRGGPHLHDLAVVGSGERLMVSFAMVQSGQTLQEQPPRPPELLADELRSVRFAYRGLDEDGRLAPWQDRWATAEALPVQVSVQVETLQGERWPPLVVSLAYATGGSFAGEDLEPPL